MFESYKNFGVLEGQRSTDWAGGTIPYEVRNPSGDWESHLPLEEWQLIDGVDLMACVTFAELSSCETQVKQQTGQQINFSDRFTATMSGTTQQGNWLWKVGDSIRKDGLVLESDWPVVRPLQWTTYYTPPTIEVVNKGKVSLEQYSTNYEFIDFTKESLIYHLKHAPIIVIIPGHAILNFKTTEQIIKYFDSYSPFIKETQSVSSAMKLVLTVKQKVMNDVEVRKLYRLAFYREPDAGELAFWTGRSLAEFLTVALKDRAEFLSSPL